MQCPFAAELPHVHITPEQSPSLDRVVTEAQAAEIIGYSKVRAASRIPRR
jgi:hypothetical protein